MNSLQPHVVMDVDGTVCHTVRGTDFEDAESLLRNCKPFQGACATLRRMHEAGTRITYLTGRPIAVATTTLGQLQEWVHQGILPNQVIHRTRLQFSWQHYKEDKVGHLRHLKPDLYVGDRIEDQEAAQGAMVPFQWAIDFRARGIQHQLGAKA
jgi:phosphoglycolate phosphatase-like HAD superfamily hydrolase